MKLHHSDDETGVTLSDRDRDVLRAAFDTAEAMRDLADAAGLLGRGTCAECGDHARTRPMRVFEDGEPTTAQVCGDCQAEMVEADEAETPEDVAEIDVDAEPVEDDGLPDDPGSRTP